MDKCIWLSQYDNFSVAYHFFDAVCTRCLGYGFEYSNRNDEVLF